MIQCFLRHEERVRTIEPGEVAGVVQEAKGVLWVDVEAPTEADGEFLGRTFGFHALAIEDCLSPLLRQPKLDDYGSYLFLVVHGINHNLPPGVLDTHELDLFLGPNYLVTCHLKPSMSVKKVKEACLTGRDVMASPAVLAHLVIDSQVDNMLPPVQTQAQVLSNLKRDILEQHRPAHLRTALSSEEALLKVRSAIVPELGALQALSHKESFVPESTRLYFRDVQDHLNRLQDMIGMLLEMVESNLALHLSVTANRSADFTKALSLVAMIFLPLALVASIYGMNFKHMPELEWKYGYLFILVFILSVGVGLVAFYRWKRWV